MDALKKRILAINSVFENDSTELKCDYCEGLDDGRGFTAVFLVVAPEQVIYSKLLRNIMPDNQIML